MSDYKPAVGDRVRVVLEGEVRNVGLEGFGIGVENYVFPGNEEFVSVEKIEPPVTVFKPGDVVRDKENQRWRYAIGKKGYTQLSDGTYFEDGEQFLRDEFTSERYEKVSLG